MAGAGPWANLEHLSPSAGVKGSKLSAWDSYDYEIVDATAVGDDRVFLHGRIKAEGRVSGASLEGDIYHCCWLRHGRFIRIEDHLTKKGALEALG